MVRRAFPAEVTNGQLRFQESLVDLEGRRVMVVLDDLPTKDENRPRLTPDPVQIDDMDVEQDVPPFRRPFRWKTVNAVVKDGGPLRPCLILPEELPDD